MLTFIKLGGSLITDKKTPNTFRADVAQRIAAQIARAIPEMGNRQLLIGHGSGSFGHMAARAHGTMAGVVTPEQWRGYAEVAAVAAELNGLMTQTLRTVGIPILRIQPSASARAHDGVLIEMALDPVRQALAHGLVPLVYGDVALDTVRGGTIISTETVFTYLAHHLPVSEILELGDTEGVYDTSGVVIPQITPSTLSRYEAALGGSAGTDVTGGMRTKVMDLLHLAQALPALRARILSGLDPNALHTCLTHPNASIGTVIING
jgi:isopentenyl phosphate kinase